MIVEDEVRQRFGLVPNFFRLTPSNPGITEHLWGFARYAYMDNPLPSLFKERLFVWLSRFCEVRYCIGRHVGFLLGLGHVAGDSGCRAQSIEDVMRLLTREVPHDAAVREHIARCAALDAPLAEVPGPDSELEWSIFACATHVFLRRSAELDCVDALRRALGPSRLEQLLLLLTFVQAAHIWTRTHPELAFEDDIEDLLATHQQLRSCLLDDPEMACSEIGRHLLTELDTLRQEKQQLMRDSEARLEHDLAESRLLHDISNELISEQHIGALYLKIIDAAVRLLDASGGSLQILVSGRDGSSELRLLGERGFDPEAVAFWRRVRAGSTTACGAALASGQRVIVPDTACWAVLEGSDDLAVFERNRMRALQTTPLYSRSGAMVGALSTYWQEPHQPQEHELQLLDILARQAADLIERTKVEEALRASQDRFRRALQPDGIGVIFFDPEGGITEANDAFLDMSGYTRADLEAGLLRWDRMTPPEWMEPSLHALEEFKRTGRTTPYEKEYIRKDGSRWMALFAGTRLSEDEGVEFVVDITDRKRAEQALRDADRNKDVFLATLAHELRNPLAPISNAMHLLRRTDGRRKADRLMEIVERQVRQIVRLVDDLLEVSRIAGGKIELVKTRVALADIVGDAVETSRPLIEQAHHTLNVSLPETPVMLDVDRVRVTQVLSNLLNNATKYTDPGGHIWLTAHCQAGEAVISVRDDGIGIAPDQLSRIFDIFAQVHPLAGRDQGGLGIGLSMVRSLVEMHGGRVEARSSGPGSGCEFVVRLPLPQSVPVTAAAQPAAARVPSLSGQRILIVDDNRDAADSLGLLLQAEGAEVKVAYGGRDALADMEAFQPATVLLDLGMPDMDGYAVARQLREDGRYRDTRIVALTGWGQESDRRKTQACGFDFHMTKPVELARLKAWLNGGQHAGA
jgi:PAS domain S-box-containing protein